MTCTLCCSTSQTITTDCRHSFHIGCLQQHWQERDWNLQCPTCCRPLAKVHDTGGNCFIGFDTQSSWVACYTLDGNQLKPVCVSFQKWKRHASTQRLEKFKSIDMRTHIVVS